MKKISKALLLAVLLTIGRIEAIQAQSIFTPLDITPDRLSGDQRMMYDKIQAQQIYSSINFVRTQNIYEVSQTGKVNISLPYAGCGSIDFSAEDVSYSSPQNFSWYGRSFVEEDDPCAYGSFTLMANNGLLIGSFSIDEHSYQLYDLTGGIQVVCEADPNMLTGNFCGNKETPPDVSRITAADPCENVQSKVLVLYTPAAQQVATDINGTANLAITQINHAYAASGIDNKMVLAGVAPLNFTENTQAGSNEQNIDNDKVALANNPTAQTLRNQYKAEIVVLLTKPVYGYYRGVAVNIGGTFNEAYAIVDVTTAATSGRFTLAHEVTHIMGGRHDDDPDPGTAHGYKFRTGDFLPSLFGKRRFTLMASNPYSDLSNLENVSNPDVDFYHHATGSSDHNNAQKVNDMKNYVAAFYPDPSLPLYASVTMRNPPVCSVYGSATVNTRCGKGTLTYQWYFSDNGYAWTACGNTQTITTIIPVPANNATYNTRIYKCVVKDAGNAISESTGVGSYRCTNRDKNGSTGGVARKISGEAAQTNGVHIVPNPNNGLFNATVSVIHDDDVSVILYDLTGREIALLYKGHLTAGVHQFAHDKKLAAGIYQLAVTGKSTKISEQVHIQ